MNSAQAAITKSRGPCVILAGAGTGKTHTIVEKITHLIKSGVYEADKIVCITFSNEAAANVFMRVQRAFTDLSSKEPIIRTFHAFSADLLRAHGSKIGITSEFKILDTDEAMVLLHKHLRVQPYYCRKYIAALGSAKDLGIGLESMQTYLAAQLAGSSNGALEQRHQELGFLLQTLHTRSDDSQKQTLREQLCKIEDILALQRFLTVWRAYEKIKEKQGYLDYADLNVAALKLLEQYPELSRAFSYVIVDEFQDTNKLQLDFLLRLASEGNITIVGDLNQSIYRFRGAYKQNFSLFKKHFGIKESDIFALDRSYRSSNSILRVAHTLILHNYENPAECFEVTNAQGREGEPIEIYELNDGREEARKVVELVQREIKRGIAPQEICIMFRTHQQGRVIKKALEREAIPFSSVHKQSLLSHSAIKTVIDYLTVLHRLENKGRGGEQAWWDLFYRLSFGEKDLMVIGKFMKDHKEEACISAILHSKLLALPLSERGRMIAKVVIERIDYFRSFAKEDVISLLRQIYSRSGVAQDQKTKEGKEAFLNLGRFLELAQTHASLYGPDMGSFLHYLDILHTLEIEIPAANSVGEGVQLMTNHATKGLEYKVVIVTNLAHKRFPMERIERNVLLPAALLPELREQVSNFNDGDALRIYEQKQQLAEERRLCYVAFTRARERLILTYAQNYAQKKHYPSQFLHEINFQKNKDCIFKQELEKHAFEEPLVLMPAARFTYVLHSPEFDELLPKVVQAEKREGVIREQKAFSPSALLLFTQCEKQYEYQYVYHMPERRSGSWEAMRLGSFVHLVLEKGVKDGFGDVKSFLDYAKELLLREDWASIDFTEAAQMIRVFFERNKMKYSTHSKTEQVLPTKLGGFSFIGFADRIDLHPQGLEIIDYKTGKTQIAPLHRNWQLGYYALAARHLGRVYKITLDMLKHEKPLEFTLDEEGNAQGVHSERMDFNIYEVEEELIRTAQAILTAHQNGFKACPLDKNCEFCNEYVHGL